MNIQNTNFSGLLKQSTKHTLKVSSLLQKLVDVTKFTHGTSKLIIDRYDKIAISTLATKIFSELNMTHPIVKLLVDDVARIGKTGENGCYYIKLISGLLKVAIELLEDGVDAKKLARVMGELKTRICDENERVFIALDKHKKKETMGRARRLVNEALKIAGKKENIRICKISSGDMDESVVVDGLVFNRGADGDVKGITDARCVIYNCGLDVVTTETKGVVQFKTAEEMKRFSGDEENEIIEFVNRNNAGVILFNGQLGQTYKELLDEKGVVMFKIQSKFDIHRIAELTGAKTTNSLIFKEENCGKISVEQWEECGVEYTRMSGPGKMATIIVRDCLVVNCDEMEREINLVLNSIQCNKTTYADLKQVELGVLKSIEKISEFKSDQSLIVLAKIRELFIEKRDTELCVLRGIKKSFKSAFELIELLLITDDYLVTEEDKMDIKEKTNKNWDDDDVMC